jgi:adenylate kinase
MNLTILGKQASGKGTQAELLAKKFGLFRVEMGNILKEIAKTDPKINEMVNVKGELVPDEVTFKVAVDYIKKNYKGNGGILFDGYPRSEGQYQLLKEWMKNRGEELERVIWLEISDKEAINRISARRVCEKCGNVYNLNTNPPPSKDICECGGRLVQRKDDSPDAVRKRLKWSKEVMRPLLKTFKEEGKLIEVDGERPIEVIFDDIVEKLKDVKDTD